MLPPRLSLIGLFGPILALAFPLDLEAQDPNIRVVEATDDISGRSDTRVIVLSDSLPLLQLKTDPDDYKGASIIVACGNRVPADSGRALMLFGGQPIEPFASELGYAEIMFDNDQRPRKAYMAILDYGDALVVPTGGRSTRHLAYLGDDGHPYYSEGLLRAMLGATVLHIRYKVIGQEWRTAHFQLGGLRESLAKLTQCSWPHS